LLTNTNFDLFLMKIDWYVNNTNNGEKERESERESEKKKKRTIFDQDFSA